MSKRKKARKTRTTGKPTLLKVTGAMVAAGLGIEGAVRPVDAPPHVELLEVQQEPMLSYTTNATNTASITVSFPSDFLSELLLPKK